MMTRVISPCSDCKSTIQSFRGYVVDLLGMQFVAAIAAGIIVAELYRPTCVREAAHP
jgi:hypothetical protein